MATETAETRAAIERLRRMRAESSANDGGYPDTAAGRLQSACDHAHVADLYLAEHPADDAEPVTDEWLMANGFRVREDGVLAIVHMVEHPVRIIWSIDLWHGRLADQWNCAVQRMTQYVDRIAWPHPETRGDVRRLCAALGIPLTATS